MPPPKNKKNAISRAESMGKSVADKPRYSLYPDRRAPLEMPNEANLERRNQLRKLGLKSADLTESDGEDALHFFTGTSPVSREKQAQEGYLARKREQNNLRPRSPKKGK